MKLAISNIAWPHEAEPGAAEIMAANRIGGVEIAPTKIWPKPLTASDDEIDRYRRFWLNHGIQVVAIQSLLFGRPDLNIFGAAEKRRTRKHFAHLPGTFRVGHEPHPWPEQRSRRGAQRAVQDALARESQPGRHRDRAATGDGGFHALEYGRDFAPGGRYRFIPLPGELE